MRSGWAASIAGPPIGWDSCGNGYPGRMTSPDAVDVDQPLAVDVPAAPHDASGERVPTRDLAGLAPPARSARRWTPSRVVATPAALDHPHGQRIVERVEALGIEVERLRANRLTGVRGQTDRETYARAKSTMAIVVSPPSRRVLQPIAPSADWRFDLAEGCPAHCQYCYLAGSLSGPPVTRVYADLDDILAGLSAYAGRGHGHQPQRAARRRGHHLRGVLLHRPARPGAPDRQLAAGGAALRRLGRAGAVALDHQVRRRGHASSGCRTPAGPGSASASTAPR